MSWNRGFSFTLYITWRDSYCYTVHLLFFMKPLIHNTLRHPTKPPVYFAWNSESPNQITWKWKQFYNVRLNRLDFSYLNTWKITQLNYLFAYLFELLPSPIAFSVLIFYICSDTVTRVQNNIVFGVVIVQRSAHTYNCFETLKKKKIVSWHKILVQQKKTTQCSFPLETLSPKPLISGV